jgi:hypothetical protein
MAAPFESADGSVTAETRWTIGTKKMEIREPNYPLTCLLMEGHGEHRVKKTKYFSKKKERRPDKREP